MTKCNLQTELFAPVRNRKIEISTDGAGISSDAGSILLRELDRKLKISKQIASRLPDPRNQCYVAHSLESLVRQRLYALALGYEDYNDHDSLRKDSLLQSAVDRCEDLAGKSTICRFEQSAEGSAAIESLDHLLLDLYIKTRTEAPTEIILDFDATDTPLFGEQEGRHFHGYYDRFCYLPLLVFAGDFPLHAMLRKSDSDPAKGSLEVLERLTGRLRKQWKDVRIIFRADAGFCRDELLTWCEANDVEYIVGYSKNSVLMKHCEDVTEKVRMQFEDKMSKQKHFTSFDYKAGKWSAKRRTIIKAEYNAIGPNTRFIVTNLKGGAQELYENVYCARGDMENRIKEQQTDLFGSRMSTSSFAQNSLRFLMSTFAYILVNQLRSVALKGTELAKSYCGTIRSKLLKIAAVVVRNTRSIKVSLSSSHPFKDLFIQTAERLHLMTS